MLFTLLVGCLPWTLLETRRAWALLPKLYIVWIAEVCHGSDSKPEALDPKACTGTPLAPKLEAVSPETPSPSSDSPGS